MRISIVIALLLSSVALVAAVALPWELRFGLESFLLCSGPRPFIGTGVLLAVPILLSFILIVNSLVVLRAAATGRIDSTRVLLLTVTMTPGLALWSYLHRWRCFGDSGDYHAALSVEEEAQVPLIVEALGHPFLMSAVLWLFSAVVLVLALWSYLAARNRSPA